MPPDFLPVIPWDQLSKLQKLRQGTATFRPMAQDVTQVRRPVPRSYPEAIPMDVQAAVRRGIATPALPSSPFTPAPPPQSIRANPQIGYGSETMPTRRAVEPQLSTAVDRVRTTPQESYEALPMALKVPLMGLQGVAETLDAPLRAPRLFGLPGLEGPPLLNRLTGTEELANGEIDPGSLLSLPGLARMGGSMAAFGPMIGATSEAVRGSIPVLDALGLTRTANLASRVAAPATRTGQAVRNVVEGLPIDLGFAAEAKTPEQKATAALLYPAIAAATGFVGRPRPEAAHELRAARAEGQFQQLLKDFDKEFGTQSVQQILKEGRPPAEVIKNLGAGVRQAVAAAATEPPRPTSTLEALMPGARETTRAAVPRGVPPVPKGEAKVEAGTPQIEAEGPSPRGIKFADVAVPAVGAAGGAAAGVATAEPGERLEKGLEGAGLGLAAGVAGRAGRETVGKIARGEMTPGDLIQNRPGYVRAPGSVRNLLPAAVKTQFFDKAGELYSGARDRLATLAGRKRTVETPEGKLTVEKGVLSPPEVQYLRKYAVALGEDPKRVDSFGEQRLMEFARNATATPAARRAESAKFAELDRTAPNADENQLFDIAKKFSTERRWYQEAWKTIRQEFPSQLKSENNPFDSDAELFARLVAATSPGNSVKANIAQAKKAMSLVLQGREDEAWQLTFGRYAADKTYHPNLRKVYGGEPYDWLRDPKIKSFANNLMGELDDTTIDEFATKFFLGVDKTYPSDVERRWMIDKVQRLAHRLGWKPAEVQAALWVADAKGNLREGLGGTVKAAMEGQPGLPLLRGTLEGRANPEAFMIPQEALPGRRANLLPELLTADAAVKRRFTNDIERELFDPETGGDLIQKAIRESFGEEASKLKVVREQGAGAYGGEVNPNMTLALSQYTPTHVVRAYASLRGLVLGQDAQVWVRRIKQGELEQAAQEGVPVGKGWVMERPGALVSEAEYRNIYQRIGSDPKYAPLDGSTLLDGKVLFRNFTDLADDQYGDLLDELLGAEGGRYKAKAYTFAGEYLDGMEAYHGGLGRGRDALRSAANLVRERLAPVFKRYATELGVDPAAARQRVLDYADQLERGSGARGGFATPGVVGALAGGIAGGAAGATTGGPDEEGRLARVAAGAVGGAAVGGLGAGLAGAKVRARRAGGVPEPAAPPRPLTTFKGPTAEAIERTKAGVRAIEEEPRLGPGPFRSSTLPEKLATPAKLPKNFDPAEYLNPTRFDLNEHVQKTLADETKRVASELGIDYKEVEPHDKVRAEARKIEKEWDLQPGAFDRLQPGRMNRAEVLAIRNRVNQNTQALSTWSQFAEHAGKDDLELAQGVIGSIQDENTILIGKLMRAGTEAGRNLNAMKIEAANSLDPIMWKVRAARLTHDGQLTGAQQEAIDRVINEVKDGTKPPEAVARTVNAMADSDPLEKFLSARKAGLLTGPKTHLKNTISNTAMTTMEMAKDYPATVIDRLLGHMVNIASEGKTGQTFTKAASSTLPGAALKGAREGVGELSRTYDLRNVWELAKSGEPGKAALAFREAIRNSGDVPGAVTKWDAYKNVNYDNPWFDAYVKGTFGALSAADRVFKRVAYAKAIEEQARVIALREGLKRGSEAFEDRVLELVKSPREDLHMMAIEAAEVATFTNKGALAGMMSAGKRAAQQRSPALAATIDWILPFTSTPANVASRVAEYAAGGIPATIDFAKLMKASFKAAKGVTPEEVDQILRLQRRVAERGGRQVAGAAAILAGYQLGKHNLMSGSRPEDSGDWERWKETGKRPNSVLLNGKWRSLEGISPLGNLMAVGANMADVMKEPEKSLLQAAAVGSATISKTISEQSFLQGLEEALQAGFEDPVRYGKQYAAKQPASLVPTIVRNFAQGSDKTMRDTKSGSFLKQAGNEFMAGIPGASRTLPAQTNELGEPVQRTGGTLRAILDPFYSSEDLRTHDPLIAELDRVGVGLSKVAKWKDVPETEAQYRQRRVLIAENVRKALQSVTDSPEYKQVPESLLEQLRADHPDFQPDRAAQQKLDAVARSIQKQMLEDAASDVRSELNKRAKRAAAAGR